jgi:hypothetical protein
VSSGRKDRFGAGRAAEGAEPVYHSFAVTRPTVEPVAPGAAGWTLGGDDSLAGEQNIHTHPDWDGDLQNNSLDDLGVTSSTGPSPASRSPLPAAGYSLEAVAHGTAFTVAGYGVTYVKPADGPKKPTADALLQRHFTPSPPSNLTCDTIISPSTRRTSGPAAGSARATRAAPRSSTA